MSNIEITESIASNITGPCETCTEPATCLTPLDDDAPVRTCWRCAHLLTHHEATFATLAAERSQCVCPESEIFPIASEPSN